MKNRKHWLLMLIFVLLLGILAACSSDAGEGDNEPDDGTEQPEGEGDGDGVTDGPQMGGTIVGAMDTAPTGLFNPIFYTEAYEANILDFTHEGLLSQNENLEFEPNLAKKWTFNEDQTQLTLELEQGVKWHDGEEFTAADVVFTYKTIASPGYVEAGGVRDDYVIRLKGFEAFRAGETDVFEGVTADGDYTVTFHFTEPNVTALSDASFPIIPEHIFKDIPVAEIPTHAASLEPGKVIGTGPFKFTEMIDGEQYVLEKHADYWKGEPYLDGITWRVVDQAVILGLLENQEIDFVADPNGFQPADYETVAAMDHLSIIEQPDFGYQIMGLFHNHRTPEESEAGVINPENWVPNEDLASKEVRQAIAYAINRQGLIDGLLYGKGSVINAPIATQFWAYDGENPNQYPFDPEKAKQLLDDAGYVDTNGDGFREDPNGEEWVLSLHFPLGNQLRERSAPIIEEMLEAVGINIDLAQPMEMAAYVPELETNTDWDLYLLGWSLGSGDPDPSGLWGSTAAYNFGRWYNPEADQLLQDALTPPDAFEQDYRKQVYSDWQVMFQDDLPAVILYAQNSLWAYNKRIQGIEPLPYSMYNEPQLWWVNGE
ncbi:peptide/nickel transport system substrate-binding protein [Bacillus oleivorans]|uniref:Peptide/nickel transport system substrate-binding protein n=1 Tax=Bacillus oleivorans TaxID=1448271 RepID=A0A285D458_9BACI|nr:peptide/nickel transport system substrate-binding protein [Bacillus oleivorans]